MIKGRIPHNYIVRFCGTHRGNLDLHASTGEGNGNPLQYILAQRIPWTEKPDGPQSIGSQRVGHD